MTKFDPYLEEPCDKDIAQRYGLITMYYSTKGDDWTDNAGWLGEQNECQWLGITCSGGKVTDLELGKSMLDCF